MNFKSSVSRMPKIVWQLFKDKGPIAQALLGVWELYSHYEAKPAPRIPAAPQHPTYLPPPTNGMVRVDNLEERTNMVIREMLA